MADCSYYRCIQERRSIKRELQKWYKDMVYIVGESKIPYFISILDRKCLEVLPGYLLLHFYASTIIARCSRRRIRRRRWRKKAENFFIFPKAAACCFKLLRGVSFAFGSCISLVMFIKVSVFSFPPHYHQHPTLFVVVAKPVAQVGRNSPRIQIKSAPEIRPSSGRTKNLHSRSVDFSLHNVSSCCLTTRSNEPCFFRLSTRDEFA